MSQHLPSAGAFTRFPRGLHPSIGFLAGWGYALVESLGAPVAYLIFASQLASLFTTGSGTSFNVVWVLLMFVRIRGHGARIHRSKISTETGTALGRSRFWYLGF
jgi:amino acid transporter